MDSDSDNEDDCLISENLRKLKNQGAPFSQSLFSQSWRGVSSQSRPGTHLENQTPKKLSLKRSRESSDYLPENPVPQHISDKSKAQLLKSKAQPLKSKAQPFSKPSIISPPSQQPDGSPAIVITDSSSERDLECRPAIGHGFSDFTSSPDIPIMLSLSASRARQSQSKGSNRLIESYGAGGEDLVIAETSEEELAAGTEIETASVTTSEADKKRAVICTQSSALTTPTVSSLCVSHTQPTKATPKPFTVAASSQAVTGTDHPKLKQSKIVGTIKRSLPAQCRIETMWQTERMDSDEDDDDEDDCEESIFNRKPASCVVPSRENLTVGTECQKQQPCRQAERGEEEDITLPKVMFSSKRKPETASQQRHMPSKKDRVKQKASQSVDKVKQEQTIGLSKFHGKLSTVDGSSSDADIESVSSGTEEEGTCQERLPAQDKSLSPGKNECQLREEDRSALKPLLHTVEVSTEGHTHGTETVSRATQPYEDATLTYGESTMEYSQMSPNILEQETQPVGDSETAETDELCSVQIHDVKSLKSYLDYPKTHKKDVTASLPSVPPVGNLQKMFSDSSNSSNTFALHSEDIARLASSSTQLSSCATIEYGRRTSLRMRSSDSDLTQPYEPVSDDDKGSSAQDKTSTGLKSLDSDLTQPYDAVSEDDDSQGLPTLAGIPSVPSLLGRQVSGESLPPPLLTKRSSSIVLDSQSTADSSAWPALSAIALGKLKQEREETGDSMEFSPTVPVSRESRPSTASGIKMERLKEPAFSLSVSVPSSSSTSCLSQDLKSLCASTEGNLTVSVGFSGVSEAQVQALQQLKTEIGGQDENTPVHVPIKQESDAPALLRRTSVENPIDLEDDADSEHSECLFDNPMHALDNEDMTTDKKETTSMEAYDAEVYMSDAEEEFYDNGVLEHAVQRSPPSKKEHCGSNHSFPSGVQESESSSFKVETLPKLLKAENKSQEACTEPVTSAPPSKEELICYTVEEDYVTVFDSDEEEMFSSFTQVEVKTEPNMASDEEDLWADDISDKHLLEADADHESDKDCCILDPEDDTTRDTTDSGVHNDFGMDSDDDEELVAASASCDVDQPNNKPSLFSQPTLVDEPADTDECIDDIFLIDTQVDDVTMDDHSLGGVSPRDSPKKEGPEEIENENNDFDDEMDDAMFAAATQIDQEMTPPVSAPEAGVSTSVTGCIDLTMKSSDEEVGGSDSKATAKKVVADGTEGVDSDSEVQIESDKDVAQGLFDCPTLVDDECLYVDSESDDDTRPLTPERSASESKGIYDVQTLADGYVPRDEDVDLYSMATQRDFDPYLAQTQIDPIAASESDKDTDEVSEDERNRNKIVSPVTDSDVTSEKTEKDEKAWSLSDSDEELPDLVSVAETRQLVSQSATAYTTSTPTTAKVMLDEWPFTKISSGSSSKGKTIESARETMTKINERNARSGAIEIEPQMVNRRRGKTIGLHQKLCDPPRPVPVTRKGPVQQVNTSCLDAEHLTDKSKHAETAPVRSAYTDQLASTSTLALDWLNKRPDAVGPKAKLASSASSKPKQTRKRRKLSNSPSLSEVTKKARQDMEARRLKAITNPALISAVHHGGKDLQRADEDMNMDVELPSTQEVFEKGLPLITATMPIAKKRLNQMARKAKEHKAGSPPSSHGVTSSHSKGKPGSETGQSRAVSSMNDSSVSREMFRDNETSAQSAVSGAVKSSSSGTLDSGKGDGPSQEKRSKQVSRLEDSEKQWKQKTKESGKASKSSVKPSNKVGDGTKHPENDNSSSKPVHGPQRDRTLSLDSCTSSSVRPTEPADRRGHKEKRINIFEQLGSAKVEASDGHINNVVQYEASTAEYKAATQADKTVAEKPKEASKLCSGDEKHSSESGYEKGGTRSGHKKHRDKSGSSHRDGESSGPVHKHGEAFGSARKQSESVEPDHSKCKDRSDYNEKHSVRIGSGSSGSKHREKSASDTEGKKRDDHGKSGLKSREGKSEHRSGSGSSKTELARSGSSDKEHCDALHTRPDGSKHVESDRSGIQSSDIVRSGSIDSSHSGKGRSSHTQRSSEESSSKENAKSRIQNENHSERARSSSGDSVKSGSSDSRFRSCGKEHSDRERSSSISSASRTKNKEKYGSGGSTKSGSGDSKHGDKMRPGTVDSGQSGSGNSVQSRGTKPADSAKLGSSVGAKPASSDSRERGRSGSSDRERAASTDTKQKDKTSDSGERGRSGSSDRERSASTDTKQKDKTNPELSGQKHSGRASSSLTDTKQSDSTQSSVHESRNNESKLEKTNFDEGIKPAPNVTMHRERKRSGLNGTSRGNDDGANPSKKDCKERPQSESACKSQTQDTEKQPRGHKCSNDGKSRPKEARTLRPPTPPLKANRAFAEHVSRTHPSPSENQQPESNDHKSVQTKSKTVRFDLARNTVAQPVDPPQQTSMLPNVREMNLQRGLAPGGMRPYIQGNPLQKRLPPLQEQQQQKLLQQGQQQQRWQQYVFKPLVESNRAAGSSGNEGTTQGQSLLGSDDLIVPLLKWNFAWFTEYEKMLERAVKVDNLKLPPIVDLSQLYPLVTTYGDKIVEYQQIFLKLLLLEAWEEMFRSWREKQHKNPSQPPCHVYLTDTTPPQTTVCLGWTGLLTGQEVATQHHPVERDLVVVNMVGHFLPKASQGATQQMAGKEVKHSQLAFVEKISISKCQDVHRLTSSNPQLKDHPAVQKGNCDVYIFKITVKIRYQRFAPSKKCLITISPMGSLITILRQFTALQMLPRCPLMRDILSPSPIASGLGVQMPAALRRSTSVNEEQSQAINAMLQAAEQETRIPKICLLQGPPGTGKSHVIVDFIVELLKKKRDARICLTAPSNAAADELMRRLIRKKRTHMSLSAVRIGNVDSIHPEVKGMSLENRFKKVREEALCKKKMQSVPQTVRGERERLLKNIAQKEESISKCRKENKKIQVDVLQGELRKLRKEKDVIEKRISEGSEHVTLTKEEVAAIYSEELKGPQVVCGTLSSFGHPRIITTLCRNPADNRRNSNHFTCAIIDEATQATELNSLIPLQYGVTKLFLVGDPNQLPPTVLSAKAQNLNYGLSLFERLYNHFQDKDQGSSVMMLRTQYRMDPAICHFPNQYVYNGLLRTDPTVKESCQKFPLHPYVAFDIEEGQELLSQSGTLSNEVEADCTAVLCEQLVNCGLRILPSNIGIICPYAGQKRLVISKLRERYQESCYHEILSILNLARCLEMLTVALRVKDFKVEMPII